MPTIPKNTLLLLGFIILFAIAFGTFLFFQNTNRSFTYPFFVADKLPPGHLIPNVEYQGQYLGTALSNQASTGVKTILTYWGGPLISDKELLGRFEPFTKEEVAAFGIYTIAGFFQENGYDAQIADINDATQVKHLIANNVPVYVSQLFRSDIPELITAHRIYIGYSDADRTFIVHDNNFGNNYTISYDEFNKLNEGEWGKILVILPTDYVLDARPRLQSADMSDYPARLGIMDDIGLREVQTKIVRLNYYKNRALIENIDGVTEAVRLLEDIISHEAFNRLHPAARMLFSYNLTGFYMSESPNYPRAIEILETITLPVVEEYDFSKPFGEWDRKMDPSVYDSPFWKATPWARLGFLYIRTNNPTKARQAFNKSLEHVPGYPEALEGLSQL